MKLLMGLFFGILALSSSSGKARSHLVLIGFGEKMSHAADLPDRAFNGYDLGYKYDAFCVFWVPVLTFGGEYVVYRNEDRTYAIMNESERSEMESYIGSSAFTGNYWAKKVNYIWLILLAVWLYRAVREVEPKRPPGYTQPKASGSPYPNF